MHRKNTIEIFLSYWNLLFEFFKLITADYDNVAVKATSIYLIKNVLSYVSLQL